MHGDETMQLIDIFDIARKAKCGKRTAFVLVARPDFPAARHLLGPRSRRWVEAEVDAYLGALPVAARIEPPALAEGRSKSQQLPPAERRAEAARKRFERENARAARG